MLCSGLRLNISCILKYVSCKRICIIKWHGGTARETSKLHWNTGQRPWVMTFDATCELKEFVRTSTVEERTEGKDEVVHFLQRAFSAHPPWVGSSAVISFHGFAMLKDQTNLNSWLNLWSDKSSCSFFSNRYALRCQTVRQWAEW